MKRSRKRRWLLMAGPFISSQHESCSDDQSTCPRVCLSMDAFEMRFVDAGVALSG